MNFQITENFIHSLNGLIHNPVSFEVFMVVSVVTVLWDRMPVVL
jgi:hypothetical protein